MTERLSQFLQEQKKRVEAELLHYMQQTDAPPSLVEAMSYSLMAGGKRIRPAFLFAVIDALGGDQEVGLPAACALEMIHTYSLIHDDLPAMDNDDYRRGKLTNHKVFGEAMAILSGDALLTYAFYVLANQNHPSLSAETKLKMIADLALYAGAGGMVGGQVADIEGDRRQLNLQELEFIHQHKTADLLICSVRLGCYAAGASEQQLEHLSRYAKHIGHAFQIQDDILDVIGDPTKLGKAVGSDQDNQKTTYVSLLGLEEAKQELYRHKELAKEALLHSDVEQGLLLELADFIITRES